MMHYEQPPVRERRNPYFHTTPPRDGNGSSRSAPHAFQTPRAMQTPDDVTALLLRWSDGDEQARDALLPLVYDELRRMARYRLRSERDDHTLNTTALVHEAYLRLVDGEQVQWNDRTHFLALASRMMRRILIDYANRRRTAKRGGGQPHVELDEFRLVPDERVEALLELDEALQRLEAQHPRPGQAIAHCYFGGLTNDEAAAVLGVSRATVERDLRFARAWLANALGSGLDVPEASA